MDSKLIEQMRQMVADDMWPLNYNQWPPVLNGNTNCLAFALGLPIADIKGDIFGHITKDIKKFLLQFFKELDIQWREIKSLNEAQGDEFIIQAYHIYYDDGSYEFHVIRRNIDGIWVHKGGWMSPPTVIHNIDNIENILELSCTFAIKKKVS